MADNTRTLRVVIVGNSRGARDALRELGAETGRQERRNGRLGGAFDRLGSTVTKFGKAGALAFGLAAGAAAKFTFDVGASYEKSLNMISGLTGSNAAQMDRIASRLEAQSGSFANYGKSTGDAAAALVELLKAGQTLDEGMKSLNATMVLSTAGDLDVGKAAGYVSNTLNMFNLKANEAARVSNVLAQAANLSSSDVEGMGLALSQAGAVANMAGLSLEETATSLVLLSNAGIQGSDAGTSLKTMLSRLRAPVEGSAEAMKKLGVSAYDSQGKMRKYPEILNDLLRAMKPLNDQQRANAMSKLFGSDAIRSGQINIANASKGFKDIRGQIDKAGAAEGVAASRTQGLVGALARLKAQATSGAQALYRKLSPGLASVVNGFADFSATVPGRFAAAFKAMGGGDSKSVMDNLRSAGNQIKTTFEGMRPAFDRLGKGFKETMPSIRQFVKEIAPVVEDFGKKLLATLVPAFNDISDAIVNDFLPGVRAILPVITPVVKFILKVLGNAVIGVIKGAVQVIRGAFQLIGGLFKFIAAVVHGDWSGMWDGIKSIVTGVINIIVGAIKVWMNLGIIQVFRKGFLSVINGVKGAFGSIKSLFTSGGAAIQRICVNILRFITSPFRSGFGAVRGYVSSGWAYIRGSMTRGVGTVKAVLLRIVEVITYPYRRAFQIVTGELPALWGRVVGAFRAGWGRVAQVLGEIPGKVKAAFSAAGGWLKNAGMNVITGFISGIKGMAGALINAIRETITDKLPGFVKKALGIKSPSRVFRQLGYWTVEGYRVGFLSSKDRLSKAVHLLFKEMGSVKNAAVREHIHDVIKSSNARLARLITQRENVTKRLAKAQANLNSLKAAKADLSNSIKEKVKDFGGLMGNWSTDENQSNDAGTILARMQQKLAAAQAFSKNMQALLKKGLSKDLVKQIAEAGVEDGGAMAASLMAASPAQIAELNKTNGQIAKVAGDAGSKIAGQMYDSGIQAANGLVNGLKAKQAAISEQMNHIADSMVRAIKKALGIKSPSRVFMALGKHTSDGFAKGIVKGTGSVQAAMDAMSGARPRSVSSADVQRAAAARRAAMDAAGGGVNVTVHVHGSVTAERDLAKAIAGPVRDEINKIARRNSRTSGI